MGDLILFLKLRVLIPLTSKELILIYTVDIIADSGFMIIGNNAVFSCSFKLSSTPGFVFKFSLTLHTHHEHLGGERAP